MLVCYQDDIDAIDMHSCERDRTLADVSVEA